MAPYMEMLLGIVAVISAALAGFTYALAFEPEGTDFQLILGTLYALICIVCLVGQAILARMDSTKDNTKEPNQ